MIELLAGAPVPPREAELVGHDPIDPLTAKQLFLDATAFRRVIIDHKTPWAQGGTTDIDELRPLCPRDHVHRHLTRAIYRSRPDNTVQVTTPTGHRPTILSKHADPSCANARSTRVSFPNPWRSSARMSV
ncbi:HNH endonuclease signature motif containing protein [Microbacterium sp. AK031]|uniref:HNH endonuclease signature motif containing protein n=1 Tax=Microbacterium sp. AK031 TaxID=2723076 RepID=UPI0021670A83|nr:HNH endonuclease signature motif containing protein [Microbacterium sp. AK031]MCS3844843.1 hypothetical protein [Microbacterium sp. AK031]